MEEYLTIDELAGRLKLKPKTIRNKMASGIFLKAVIAWIEGKEEELDTESKIGRIPMANGYMLGGPSESG